MTDSPSELWITEGHQSNYVDLEDVERCRICGALTLTADTEAHWRTHRAAAVAR